MRGAISRKWLVLAVSASVLFLFSAAAPALETDAVLRQVTTGNVHKWHPDWSPDGQWIVYQYDKPGGTDLYKIMVDGTGETQLTGGYYCDSKPKWSPDGTQIVFQRFDAPEGEGGGDLASIWIMNSDGTNQMKIVDYLPGDIGGAQWPIWSSDGQWISFKYGESRQKGLWVVRPDGSDLRQIVDVSFAEDPEKVVSWGLKRARTKIAFSINNEALSYQKKLAVVDVRRGGIKWLTDPNEDGSCQWYPHWSPDGRKIVYNDDAANRADIWVMDSGGGNRIRLTNADITGGCYSHPTWSPNGFYILHWSSEDTGNTSRKDINVITRDGSRTLTLMEDDDLYPNGTEYDLMFSPLGDRVLFTGRDASGYWQIYVVDLNVGDDDGDRLLNWEEDVWGTERDNRDTDGDRRDDYLEVRKGRNPLDPRG